MKSITARRDSRQRRDAGIDVAIPNVDMAEFKEIVADIRRDNVRASEVILRLRSLLKKAPFQPKDADLNQIVNEKVEFLSALAVARRVEMRTSMTSAPLPIRGDRIQLQQVILNLIVNAMDAMANMPVAERQIRVSTTLVDDFAEVAVFDDGPGVPGDKLKEVFEPFFTTKKNGMGMGLTIARTIVEVHRGAMSAKISPAAAPHSVSGYRLPHRRGNCDHPIATPPPTVRFKTCVVFSMRSAAAWSASSPRPASPARDRRRRRGHRAARPAPAAASPGAASASSSSSQAVSPAITVSR